MILVQKAPTFLASSPHYVHRRYPSAPSPVVVQPTRTPGLLTLSKPIQQQPRQRNTPKPKQPAVKTSPRQQQQQSLETLAVLKPSPEILDRKPGTPVSAEKAHPRGRQQRSKPKDKPTTRSSSHSSVRGRRNNARQPSPPLPANLSSQAEASSPPYKSATSNLFDPFLDDSTPLSRSKAVRPAPTLTSRPSGKLAKRRQPNSVPFNPVPTPASTPAKAIPVPRRNHSSNSILSRSAPTGGYVPHRMPVKASSEPPDVFPICDDVSEAGADSEVEDMSIPSTPARTRSSARFLHGFDDGPRTAPITASTKSFPFNNASPTPVPSRKARKHARVPSEGVFAMSSDEEASTGDVGSDELKALFAMLPRRRPSVSLTESERERAAAAAAAAYFASSNFQNSPSPEDLPPPSFV